MALRGRLLAKLLNELMEDPYLQKQPPKTAGREQFGRSCTQKILSWANKRRA
jgi:anhydro-N-acetylmuramic acid kinase